MIRVLFVCLGNICRSPMAEAIFRKEVKDAGLANKIEVDSAGTGNWHVGEAPHHGTQKILNDNQISYDGIQARQIAVNDIDDFQYIIAMDTNNLNNMKKLFSKQSDTYVGLLLDFVNDASTKDVPDPYFTGDFDEVFGLVEWLPGAA